MWIGCSVQSVVFSWSMAPPFVQQWCCSIYSPFNVLLVYRATKKLLASIYYHKSHISTRKGTTR